jgi:hypothetical protein
MSKMKNYRMMTTMVDWPLCCEIRMRMVSRLSFYIALLTETLWKLVL